MRDFDFRPATYWNSPASSLASIKGEQRRRAVERLLAKGRARDLGGSLIAESLSAAEREAVGRLHPRLMGGEYLPDTRRAEVEIARVALSSTTGDVISLRARPHGTHIRYRLVDEYESRFSFAPRQTAEPLTLGELIALIDGANGAQGLTTYFRDRNLEAGGNPESLADFVRVSSWFYPGLEPHYADEAAAWLAKARRRGSPGAR